MFFKPCERAAKTPAIDPYSKRREHPEVGIYFPLFHFISEIIIPRFIIGPLLQEYHTLLRSLRGFLTGL